MMIKAGVDLRGMVPQMAIAYAIACEVWRRHSFVSCIITSASDGTHSAESLHYKGKALDLRTRDLDRVVAEEVARDLKVALGDQFDVVLEKTHLHVEFDPKEPEKSAET